MEMKQRGIKLRNDKYVVRIYVGGKNFQHGTFASLGEAVDSRNNLYDEWFGGKRWLKYRNVLEHPLYQSWRGMKSRCYDTNDGSYHNYGGRGIRMCDEWRLSFSSFAEDMGERPIGKTLDRTDNDGNYEPSNCRWATQIQQHRNKRYIKDTKTGFRGVSQAKIGGSYRAWIYIKGKLTFLGSFPELSDAVRARLDAEGKHWR